MQGTSQSQHNLDCSSNSTDHSTQSTGASRADANSIGKLSSTTHECQTPTCQQHTNHSHDAHSYGAHAHDCHGHALHGNSSSENSFHEHSGHWHSGHHHHHHGTGGDMGRAFALGVVLNSGFVALELLSGWWFNSVALLADAGHNLSDVLGLVMAWIAHRLAGAAASPRRTYGWKSTSILAALFNAQLLMLAVGAIVWESIHRLMTPTETAGNWVIAVAAAGVVINTFSAWLFVSGSQNDLNVRGAYLHMAADAAVSLGVVLAGALIWVTGWNWIDPATSLLIAAIIFIGTWGLLRESLDLILHAVPKHLDMVAIEQSLVSLDGVSGVHDLHVWALSTSEVALTVHLVESSSADRETLLSSARQILKQRFGIEHVTLQVENEACQQCRPNHATAPGELAKIRS